MSGYCLGSDALRDKLGDSIIGDDIREDQIQPSSFEPRLGSEAYVLDAELNGLFRPDDRRKISTSIDRLDGDHKQRVDLSDGYELKQGFTYLIPLQETVRLADDEYVKSSPKSSLGRLFLQTRLLADYNLGFDEIHPHRGRALDMYLLVQPLVFNVVVRPGLSLNQLRWFNGVGARLAPEAVLEHHETKPLLYKAHGPSLRPADLTVSDSVYLHLDLNGYGEGDVVGLRAKPTPQPIDLSRTDTYDMNRYFERVTADDGSVEVKSREYYLFGSKEVFDMPIDLSAEVYQHSATGISGPLHFAGFVDNGFQGNLVFEVRSDELSNMRVYDGMPISKVDFFDTEESAKTYGEGIGSNYDGQRRVRVAKYFRNSV
jgi:deoxycytidine triphosphate deaminase